MDVDFNESLYKLLFSAIEYENVIELNKLLNKGKQRLAAAPHAFSNVFFFIFYVMQRRNVAIGLNINRLISWKIYPFKKYSFYAALHVAVLKNDFEITKLLLDRGADIDCFAENNWNAICFALFNRYYKMVEYLLFRGANPNIKSSSNGPLSLYSNCILYQKEEFIEILSCLGGNFEEKIDFGIPELEFAAASSAIRCFKTLLELSVDKEHFHLLTYGIMDTSIRNVLEEHMRKSKEEREETRKNIIKKRLYDISIRWMCFAHNDIVGICMALSNLHLPHYIVLWIIDWLPNYHLLSSLKKIRLIETVNKSIKKLK